MQTIIFLLSKLNFIYIFFQKEDNFLINMRAFNYIDTCAVLYDFGNSCFLHAVCT